ncbi:putative ubiquitin conjugating enzyme [Xylariomycetidae sp. FL0641]|nr:putative ubiquitin conjugating enzyme [Xylariomycetidae sp. FL0641]
MYRDLAYAVYKRGEDPMNSYEIPGWAIFLLFLDLIVFLPILIFLSYTLQHVYPTLAIIEDPSPPAYEPVSLNEDNQSLAEENMPVADEAARGSESRCVTSSFRATHRTLYAIGGWRSMFRGIACYAALTLAFLFVDSVVRSAFVPALVAAPIAALACVQLYTAWTHIVITTPSPKRFYQRLPPFKKAFQATALPVCMYFFAVELAAFVPKGFATVLGMPTIDPTQYGTIRQPEAGDAWKGLLVLITTLLLQVFVVIPAQVVLTRVQASILPEEDDTIVPFDRTFQGKVEPAIVGGKGYVSVMDAWKTFTRASWIRLVKLYLKIFAAVFALSFVWALVMIPQLVAIYKNAKKAE